MWLFDKSKNFQRIIFSYYLPSIWNLATGHVNQEPQVIKRIPSPVQATQGWSLPVPSLSKTRDSLQSPTRYAHLSILPSFAFLYSALWGSMQSQDCMALRLFAMSWRITATSAQSQPSQPSPSLATLHSDCPGGTLLPPQLTFVVFFLPLLTRHI